MAAESRGQAPIDGLLPRLDQRSVRPAERLTAEEAPVADRGEGWDEQITLCRDALISFFLRWASAPQRDENDKVGLLVDDSDHFVGEPLPTFTAVGTRLPRAHSQDRVEKEDALERPPFEVPMVGCYPQVVLQLAEDVLERWRRLDAAPGSFSS